MPSKKKGTYQGKAESPTLGQQKLPCNCVTNPLAPTTRCVTNPLVPTTCCFFWPNKYPRELGLRAISSSHPWWGREALAPVSNKFPYCKLHCFEESSFLTGDSDYGQNKNHFDRFPKDRQTMVHSLPVYIGKEFLGHGQAHSLHIMYFLWSFSFCNSRSRPGPSREKLEGSWCRSHYFILTDSPTQPFLQMLGW